MLFLHSLTAQHSVAIQDLVRLTKQRPEIFSRYKHKIYTDPMILPTNCLIGLFSRIEGSIYTKSLGTIAKR